MKISEELCGYRQLFLIIPATLLVLLTPFVWRLSLGNYTLPGEYSYYYLSVLYDFFGVPPFQGSYIIYWLFGILGALILALLFYRLVTLHTSSVVAQITAPLFFISAPITIFLSMSLSPYLLALLFLFLGLNLLESRRRCLSVLPFFGLLFFDWLTFLGALVIVLGYFLYQDEKGKALWSLPFILTFILLHLVLGISFTLEKAYSGSLVTDFFSTFGSYHGLGIFMVLLCILGLIFSWRDKRTLLPVYIGLAVLFVLFFFAGAPALYIFYPVVVVLAASAYAHLWHRDWALSLIRTLTLATLAYGIFFSGLAYVNQAVHSGPTQEVLASVEWLSNHPFYSDSIVLSHPQKGFWLELDGVRRAYINYLDGDNTQKYAVMNEIFHSKDFKKTSTLLEENGISLIWIDQQMQNGQVWNEEDDGLLFLFGDARFLNVYDAGGIEIWRFKTDNSTNP